MRSQKHTNQASTLRSLLPLLTALLVVGAAVAASGRDQIRVVGSSTVFPFSTAVAEQFGKTSSFRTPVIESTGSGGGLKLFCGGVGLEHPDIANSSRRIKSSEVELCAANGVTQIVEIKIGFDGIVIANSKQAQRYSLTMRQVFLALAKEVPRDGRLIANPYTKWSDIDASLPSVRIEVLGPPPTSGTRDAFVEIAMEGGAEEIEMLSAIKAENSAAFQAIAHSLREDGHFIEAGENDNLIVQKLEANPTALGIFGFSFLDQNGDKVQGSMVDGSEPTFENIADGSYGVSRSLFFYVKRAHIGVVPGIEEFIAEFTSEKAAGDEGYLADKGLIPLPAAERAALRAAAKALPNLSL